MGGITFMECKTHPDLVEERLERIREKSKAPQKKKGKKKKKSEKKEEPGTEAKQD